MKELNEGGFEENALQPGKLTVILFTRSGIASGEILESILCRLSQDYRQSAGFFKMYVEKAPGVATRYRIGQVPTTLLLWNGEVVDDFVGVMNASKVRQKIESQMG